MQKAVQSKLIILLLQFEFHRHHHPKQIRLK